MSSEIKIVITGTVGAGKTTAIRSLCGSSVVDTDVAATDDVSASKEKTTVAMDYGEVVLPDGEKLRLYGTPGQARFRFMWEIVATGALGIVILVDANRNAPLDDMEIYLENFMPFIDQTAAVIGLTKYGLEANVTIDEIHTRLERMGLFIPAFTVDPRDAGHVAMLIDSIVSLLEFKQVR